VVGKASGVGLSVACGEVPVPMMAADCGEPVALSATETEAEKAVAEAGVKVTLIVQVAPAARLAPQLLVWAKSAALVPVTEMLLMVRAALPGLESVMGRAVAEVPTSVPGKASGLGLSVACGVGAVVPVPVRVAVCGEPVALSDTESCAEKLAAVAGVNVT
jgi:hypothetical protein